MSDLERMTIMDHELELCHDALGYWLSYNMDVGKINAVADIVRLRDKIKSELAHRKAELARLERERREQANVERQ